MESIHGFELLAPFSNENAGFSRWTFARRGGKTYFLKEFLNPAYPVNGAIGETLRKAALRACADFEDRQKRLYSRVNEASAGNLVRIEVFFRHESRYYIATEKIDAENKTVEEISSLPLETKVRLCRILAYSFARLHSCGVVHGDIKDKNILLQLSQKGQYTVKIIDFDCGYLADMPPKPGEELGGDQVYLSPESCLFMCGETVTLTPKSDVFSLGVLFHQLFTGELPSFDHTKGNYLHEAVLNQEKAEVSKEIPEEYRKLIEKMLERNPQDRCSMQEVSDCLMPQSLRNDKRTEALDPHFKLITEL